MCDVVTRFDSTVEVLSSVVRNNRFISRLQERVNTSSTSLPESLTLSNDDFDITDSVVQVLTPEKLLQSSYRSNLLVIRCVSYPVLCPRRNCYNGSLSTRAWISKFTSVLFVGSTGNTFGYWDSITYIGWSYTVYYHSTDIAIASYLSPRYCITTKSAYGYTYKSVVAELRRLYNYEGLDDSYKN